MEKNISQKNKQEGAPVNVENVIVDFIAIFFVVGYLAMDFIPYTSGIDNVGIQYLYLAVVNLILGVYLFKNPQLISKEYFSIFKNNYAIRAYLLFLLFCGLSIFVATHFSLSIISFTQLIITFCLFLNISILLYNRLYLINRVFFIFIILIFLQCFFELKHFVEVSKEQSLFTALSKLAGNTGSINIFAANMATKIPFLLFGIFAFSKYKKWLSVISLFLASLLILLTASRASFLGLCLEVIVFIILLFKINSNKKINLQLIATIIIPLILSYFIANIILAKSNDMGRFQSVDNRIGQITNLSDASVDTRLSLWRNATKIIKSNPLFGIGIGNWQIESIPYEKYEADELAYSIHTHNDFLEIASETGLLNGIIFILIFVFAVVINFKRIIKNNDNQTKIIALITLLIIITYGIDSFFNFPLHRPTMQYNLAIILAFTLINIPKIDTITSSKFTKKGILILILITSGTVYYSYLLRKALIIENDINVDYKLPEKDQKLNSAYVKSQMPEFVEVNLNSVPFYELLGKYYYKEKQYEKANACFNLSEKINPYSGKSDYFRNEIAKEKGMIDSAYFYTKRSLEIRPRCESYFYETISTAILKKDTINILKLHNDFIKYRNDPKYWINTSSALILSKCSYKNSIKFVEEGLKIFPNDSTLIERRNSFEFDVDTKKATKLMNEKKYLEAITVYNKILKKDKESVKTLQNIGLCYGGMKDYKKAIIYLEKTLNLSKNDDGKTAYYLGVCYYELKNKVKGCNYINLAVEKNYQNAANIRDKYCK